MKVYILHNRDGKYPSVNFAVADDGFRKMGWEIVNYSRTDEIRFLDLAAEDVVVGYVEDVNQAILQLGIESPVEINYPEELTDFLGRKIWRSRVNYIAKHPELWNVFIKPATRSKKFTGRVVNSPKDLISCGDELEDTEILCSEPVKFVAEWRCFVRYGEILGVKHYYGDWRARFDPQVIEAAIVSYTTAPAGYAADFGVTDRDETLLVEVNDGYSIGAYGLFPPDYARLLATRWAQITNSRDYSVY